ncbi:hypothetical protein FGG08_003224 [Glutinoglossum americanum]|uniref:Pyruvate decarboxylase n=1 Tax=Glutinoglossum americanum TaxID=1670608 RepID=A0A9P8I7N4_9PEZI|nr:hypothetical protein FGG08_003224 [Glutinoglossum americanum]
MESHGDIRTSALKNPVDLAEYLFRRIHELGVRGVHGVPGDYNLVALDYIPKVGLNWVGNCNELNAGYAADGYARVKGVGAIVTTFGVGELSIVNAQAGAYSEFVPVIHIVGTPSTISQRDGMLLHHTLGNGDFNVFANMFSQISVAVARLNDPYEAAAQVDYVLQQCMIKGRPVYITLPTDMVQKKVEGERLKTPIDVRIPKNNPDVEDYVVGVILKYLHAAKNPTILVDACAIRHGVLDEVHELVEKTKLPTFVAPMGKGAVDETLPNYGGVGDASLQGIKEAVESSDLVLSIGAIKSDFNTSGFSYQISQLSTIDFHSTFIKVKYSEYPGIHMKGVLRKVVSCIDLGKINVQPTPPVSNTIPEAERTSRDQTITQAWLWPRLGQWLEADDVGEFPKNVIAISQVLWGSIGYTVGAAQGAALAAKELGNRRVILFIGDGSFQLTCQEVSTMIRHGLKPVIFVLCNDGYTIERLIHGMNASYNDIQPWHYKDLIPAFGGSPANSKTFQIRTRNELDNLLGDKEFSAAKYLQFVELYTPKRDAPAALKLVAERAAETNEKVE